MGDKTMSLTEKISTMKPGDGFTFPLSLRPDIRDVVRSSVDQKKFVMFRLDNFVRLICVPKEMSTIGEFELV